MLFRNIYTLLGLGCFLLGVFNVLTKLIYPSSLSDGYKKLISYLWGCFLIHILNSKYLFYDHRCRGKGSVLAVVKAIAKGSSHRQISLENSLEIMLTLNIRNFKCIFLSYFIFMAFDKVKPFESFDIGRR